MGGRLDASRRQDGDPAGWDSLAGRRPPRPWTGRSSVSSLSPLAWSVCGAAALLSLALLGALVWFSQPTGDDFCYAAMHLRDVPPFVAHVYMQQGGRWSSTLTEALVSTAIPGIVRAYPFLLAGFLIIRLGSAYALARTVLHSGVTRARCAIFAAFFCLLYWSAMPSLGDSMFWMTGIFFYELTASGMLLFLAGLLRGPLTASRTFFLSLAAILLAGAHEVAACAVVLIAAAGCTLAIYQRSADRRWRVRLLVASLAGLAIALAAPGNFARATQLGESHTAVPALLLSGRLIAGRIPRWLLDPPLLLAALALLADPELRLKPEWTGDGRNQRLAAIVLVAAGSLAAGFLIPAWASDGVMPGRLLDWQYLVLLTAVLAILVLLKPAVNLPKWVPAIAACAAAFAMLAAGNPRLAAQDLAGRVPAWSQARRAALASLASFAGDPASFPALPEPPHMYFDYDVNNNPSSHPNVCMARYYGLLSITGPRTETNGADLSGRLFGK